MGRGRASLGWLGQLVAWLVILGVVVVLAAAVVVPRLAGATPYTVLTGSMQPAYPPGTLVVMKPVPIEEIGTGDVITYQRQSGKSTVVTHRVVAVGTRTDGQQFFTTQGDANNTADAEPVRPVQVKGRLWYAVPYLGYVNSALTGRQRQTAVIGVSTILIGYAAFMFVGSIRDRRRRPVEADPTASTDAAEEESDRDEPARVSREASNPWPAACAVVVGAVVVVIVVRRIRSTAR
ncbi:signal peptidase I [Nocardioides sp. WS12]|uniref:signal peptidase I n=1 Tax=Nocardioides sp. WS12 TaxID=2486272 RepID=UPI0015FE14C6|nr:signal peptidase I [Nocardioides sp. WS12]